jgi:hypothetical protein
MSFEFREFDAHTANGVEFDNVVCGNWTTFYYKSDYLSTELQNNTLLSSNKIFTSPNSIENKGKLAIYVAKMKKFSIGGLWNVRSRLNL